MTEVDDNPGGNIETHGPRRKRHGGSGKKQKSLTKRDFFKVAPIVGAGIVAGLATADYLKGQSLEKEIENFYKGLPILTDFVLTAEQKQTFLGEGWGEKYPEADIPKNASPDSIVHACDKRAQEALADLEARMQASVFTPFPEAVSYISRYFRKDVPGKIDLKLDFFPTWATGGDSIFESGISVNGEGRFEAVIAANSGLFSPVNPSVVDNILTKLAWGIGFNHEKDHHLFSLRTFQFWTSKGLSPKDALTKVIKDEHQEPYSYWNQSAAVYSLLSLGFSDKLPGSYVTIAKSWERFYRQGLNWYDKPWIEYINKAKGLQMPQGG